MNLVCVDFLRNIFQKNPIKYKKEKRLEASVFIFSGCKILSIYWFALTLSSMSNLSFFIYPFFISSQGFLNENQAIQQFLLGVIPAASYLLISIILWFSADRISRFACNHQTTNDEKRDSSGSQLFIGLS